MKPAAFKYLAPQSLEEVLAYLAEYGDECKLLAGGQSLIPAMNFRLAAPAVLIDLNRVAGLAFVSDSQHGGLQLGAMTRQSAIGNSEQVKAVSPLLHETMPFIAHLQIRNRGTVGGSIAHADPAAELPAVMTVSGATFHLRNQHGERQVAARDFFTGMFETALQADEMLIAIDLPQLPKRCGWSFMEVSRRQGDYAMAGMAAQLTLDDANRCSSAELAFLSVGDGPVRAVQTEQLLQGQVFSAELCAEAAQIAATRDIDPGSDIHASAEYRRHLVRGLTQRVLTRAFERALGQVTIDQ